MNNESFKDYISQNLQRIKEPRQIEIENRNMFLEKYPLSRIKELSIEEYCLGTEQSKDSLCYLMEFGKIGFGIGGGSAKKHGVYFNKKENCYMHGSDPIASVDEFWKNFRNEFYQFLILSGESESALPLDDYPLLQGMAMVLTKYLSLYFPQKYLTIGSINVLRNIMDALGYSYDDSMRCHQINYALNAHLKREFPELRDEDGAFLGGLAWKYINGEEIKAHKSNNPEGEKGAGLADEDVRTVHYWMYAPGEGATKWDEFYNAGIMAIGWDEIGDLSIYPSKEAMKLRMKETINPDLSYKMSALATWQFANEMQPGDIVYAKRGLHLL